MKTTQLSQKTKPITFKAKLEEIGTWTVLHLPKDISIKLPSRGMVMVDGILNDANFKIPLEPDGRGSHWFRFTKAMCEATGADAGDTVTLAIEVTKDWPEPEVPTDLGKALAADPRAHAIWDDVTPSARWDWIRWVRLTREPETRKRRVEVTLSKLKKGTRRPCCFNRNLCSEAAVSKNWILLEPNKAVK